MATKTVPSALVATLKTSKGPLTAALQGLFGRAGRRVSNVHTGQARHACGAVSSPLIREGHVVYSPFPDNKPIVPTSEPFHSVIMDNWGRRGRELALEDALTGLQFSYSDLRDQVARLASGLHGQGLVKGDVVILYSPNDVHYPLVMLACSCLGVVTSLANPTLTADEFARQMSHSDSVAVFAGQGLVSNVRKALQNKEHPNKIKRLFVLGQAEGFQPVQDLLENGGTNCPDVAIDPVKNMLALPYSSGTTGLPKGVMLSHYNCLANVIQCNQSSYMSHVDRVLGLLPFYHIYGMTVVQFGALHAGAQLHVLPRFEPQTFLTCIQDKKITFAHLVPPLLVFLAKNPEVSKFDLSSLRHLVCGAAPLGHEVCQLLMERHPYLKTLNQAYGLTETSPVTHMDFKGTHGSLGYLVGGTEAKIADIQTGSALPPGEEGELCVRGPQVMLGYYKNKQATEDMIDAEGWLHTGDVAVVNENGQFFIKDRMKELIKYKGSQVPPAEIEAILLGHPHVQDVAVVGVPDEVAGELPRAFVIRKEGSHVTEDDICQFVKEKMSHTKWLRGGAQFVEEIPKNPSGKILRRVIRAKYC